MSFSCYLKCVLDSFICQTSACHKTPHLHFIFFHARVFFLWGSGSVPQLVKLNLLFLIQCLFGSGGSLSCSCYLPPPSSPSPLFSLHCTGAGRHASVRERGWSDWNKHMLGICGLWADLYPNCGRWGRKNKCSDPRGKTLQQCDHASAADIWVILHVLQKCVFSCDETHCPTCDAAFKVLEACVTGSVCVPSNRKRAFALWVPRGFFSSPPWTPTTISISARRSLNLLLRNSQVRHFICLAECLFI